MDVLQFLLDLIFQPGSSLWLVPAINVTVLLLILMLLITGMYTEIAKIHIIVMSTLALGLLLSVNWYARPLDRANQLTACARFFQEFQKVKDQQDAQDAAGAGGAAGGSSAAGQEDKKSS